MTTTNHCSPISDDIKWVIDIRHTLDEEIEEDNGIQVSIFNTPKPLQQSKPEAFIPQFIAIGPYHHWQPELYEMEKYKLSAAKRFQKQLFNIKFQDLVDRILTDERQIRDCYHKHLDFTGETLGWMMAVDSCFLLEFLQAFSVVDLGSGSRPLKRVTSRMSHLVDNTGRKSGHNTILRDIMMLENQIPLFLLRMILELEYPSEADGALIGILTGFMKQLCPFKMMEKFPSIDMTQQAHLLALLYHILVPKPKTPPECHLDDIKEVPVEVQRKPLPEDENKGEEPTELCCNIWLLLSVLQLLKRAIFSKPVKNLVKIPWTLITIIPGLAVMKQPVEDFLSQMNGEEEESEEQSSNQDDNPTRAEEIMIPSVEELKKSGVKFCPTNGDLTSISFDCRTATLYLPTISLNVNSEVILRNLVAYETSVGSGPLIFTRYTELMTGIIDTDEDVKLLREDGVLINEMKSDEDLASVWNEMSRSVRLTKVRFIDRTIEEVNRYHNSRCSVKTRRFMKKYIFGSWPFLTFLATVLLLLLTGLQAFCSVYSCARWLNIPTVAVGEP